MLDCMIDIESFGNGRRPCIVQFGGVYFDRVTGKLGEKIEINIDPRSVEKWGGVLDADTVMWWMRQEQAARDAITAAPLLELPAAFQKVNEFLEPADCIWSHATYDFVQVTETFQMIGVKPRFKFRSARDIRTLMDLAKIRTIDYKREGTHHTALADAIYQTRYCVDALNKIEGTR